MDVWRTLDSSQKVFDHVLGHLIAQGEPAIQDDELFVFRNDRGQCCSIGCVIPDDLCARLISENADQGHIATVTDVVDYFEEDSTAWEFARFLKDNAALLGRLQYLHDADITLDEAEEYLTSTARVFRLDLSEERRERFLVEFQRPPDSWWGAKSKIEETQT